MVINSVVRSGGETELPQQHNLIEYTQALYKL